MASFFLKSLVYIRKRLPIREEYFRQKASREVWVLYPDDFTSMGHIFVPSDNMKSIS